MKKVLLAFDGKNFSEGAFDFVRRLNETSPLLAVGVFLPAIDYAELLYSFGGVINGSIYYQDIDLNDTEITQKNIDHFKEQCIRYNIEFRIHPDIEKHVISELKIESRYADLLVIGNELFYENLGRETKDEYLEKVLHKTECPVVLVPERYAVPENVIIAYDGGASSVYAIKQFAYLFPDFARLKTLLIYAGESDMPDLNNIEELAARHFEDLAIFKLEIDPKKYFNTWLEDHGNSILVTGAYGRAAFSEMLEKSFITDTINDHKLPIFIAHK